MLSDYDGDPSALAKEVGSVDGPIPVLITRNLIPFPGVMTPILIGRQPSLKLLDYLRDHPDQTFAVFAQKDASVDYPIQEDLFEVGVYAKLVKEFEVPGSNNEHSAIVIASARCRLKSLDDANNFFTAETEMIPEVFPAEDDKEFAAAVEGLRQGVEIYVKMNDDIPNEAMVALQNISNHLSIVNFVASNIVSNIYDKIMLLEEDNMKLRLFKLLKVLNRETQFLHIKKNIQNKTRADIDEQQKEYFLHQQIKNIREELGDSGESEDKRELKKKAFLKPWPDEVSKLFAKELAKLDKVTQNTVNGDPASALLEVLDPEQNNAFHDNYLDTDYDLSKVLFIATANDLNTIPRPLLDRMEVIPVSGYITEEKIEIAKRHLVPRELENTGLDQVEPKLKFTKASLEKVIENYTRESGVRQLEKQINKALRKLAFRQATDGQLPSNKITPDMLPGLLGKPPFYRDIYQGNDYAGVVTGLAWTSVGGEILFIETSLSKGKAGKLTLTGNLGDVMKESAVIALEYVKAHIDALGVDYRLFDQWNIHIHVPEGATPKDGPSAGITIATSLASALTQRKVRKNTAMTGEITLRGKVLPVGGIKEKILAAKRAGITDIVMCAENQRDVEEIPEIYRKGVTFHYVENVQQVWDFALTDELVTHPVQLVVEETTDQKEEKGQ